MVESNAGDNLKQDLVEKHRNVIGRQHPIIIVNDNKDQNKIFEQIFTEYSRVTSRPLHVFDNTDDCCDFVYEQASSNEQARCIVLVRDQFASELIPSIVHSEQIQEIIIINENPPSQQERESMREYTKVSYASDHGRTEITLPDNQTLDREVTQEERFNESMIINSAHYDELQGNVSEYDETSQRSSECLFSTKTLFRYFMLKCLLDTEPIASDNDNLIELFRTKLSVSEKGIYEFQTNYTADQAILFYTKYGFIYKELNEALRSINIDYLLRFRFVLKDIYNQLTHLMTLKPIDQTTKVYRGQYIHFYEIFDLFDSFKQRAPIVINSFFSTSLDRQVSLGFLQANSEKNSSITSVPVLFTITIKKQDASSDCPFADISQYSTIRDEKEILFTPGRMFMIDNFDMIYENGTFIYVINMNFHNNITVNLNVQYNRMKSQWQEETNNSLLHLAQLLTMSNRYDQAKELYEQVLTQKSDQQTKMICYKGLLQTAPFTNNIDETKVYTQKMLELKFDSHDTVSMPDQIVVGTEFQQTLSTFMNNAQKAISQTSLDRSLKDIASYTESNEWNDLTYQAPRMAFTAAQTLMNTQQYQLAIPFLEASVTIMNGTNNAEFDLSHKSKCYKAIGDCYRQLGDNKEALKNYTLALDENIHLRPDEHTKILFCTGKVLEATNQWEAALSEYIRAAEIYQKELPNANSNDIVEIEERIKQVTSHLCPSDK